MKKDIEKKRKKEQRVVEEMIRMYCRKVHCYQPAMRERIRQVMRFSGPRMLLYHPFLAIWHVVCSMREKRGSAS